MQKTCFTLLTNMVLLIIHGPPHCRLFIRISNQVLHNHIILKRNFPLWNFALSICKLSSTLEYATKWPKTMLRWLVLIVRLNTLKFIYIRELAMSPASNVPLNAWIERSQLTVVCNHNTTVFMLEKNTSTKEHIVIWCSFIQQAFTMYDKLSSCTVGWGEYGTAGWSRHPFISRTGCHGGKCYFIRSPLFEFWGRP